MSARKLLFVALVSMGACAAPGAGGGDDGGGGGGDDGGGSGGSKAWTKMALPGDHADADTVTGIYYSSASAGVVTSSAGENSGDNGGVFTTGATAVTATAFDSKGQASAGGALGGLDFTGIAPTPTGYVAFTSVSDVVTGDSAGHFTDQVDGNQAGDGSTVLGMRVTAAGTTLVSDGAVDTASTAPGPNATYRTTWAPESSPTVPAQIPDADCQGAPRPANQPIVASNVFINADASVIAYASGPNDDVPQICISHDHGASFVPSKLAVADDLTTAPPSGLVFANATTAIAYYGTLTANDGDDYIMRSTNGGSTWSKVALPSGVASDEIELNNAFFAPDGQHGWIVGYSSGDDAGLALVTTDGGATWAKDTTGIGAASSEIKLRAGFALDATHVWLGGDSGLLLAYTP
jgi:hypothetical protein